MREYFLPETIVPLSNAGPVASQYRAGLVGDGSLCFGDASPSLMTKGELKTMMKKSGYGSRRRKARAQGGSLAKKAMILHHSQGITLKEAWKRVKKPNG